MNSTLFIARDGVLLRKQPRKEINKVWDAHFEDLAMRTIEKANNHFDQVIVMAQLPGIGRGTTTERDQKSVNEWMIDTAFTYGGKIHEVYVCPHFETTECTCRFPSGDLFHNAIVEYDVDVSRSFFLTDQLSGVEAADACGIKPVLVLSRNGLRSLCELLNNKDEWDKIWAMDPLVCRDFYSFIEKNVVAPLSVYAKANNPPCKEVAHSNAERIHQSLQKYIEAVRKEVQISSASGL